MHRFRIPDSPGHLKPKRSVQFEDRVRAAFGPGRMRPDGVDWGHVEAAWLDDHWEYCAKTPYGHLWLLINDPIPSRGHAILGQIPLS